MKKGRGLLLAAMLLTVLAPNPQADPAYGLLRTFVSDFGRNPLESAYDIEADETGIYIVGSTYSPREQPQPSLTILNNDHTHRCSTFLEFVIDPAFVQGFSFSVEINRTHVFVAGVYWIFRYALAGVQVAAFSKSDCKLTGLYTFVLGDAFSLIPNIFSGEGVDLAVDDSGVYLLVGNPIGDKLEVHVVKFDQYLNPVIQDFYSITDQFDFGVSIALGRDSVYVAGLTNYGAARPLEGDRVFLLELDKTDLSVKNTTLVRPIEKYFAGLEVVVDENNDIYLVQTYQKYMAINGVVVSKFDRRMNLLWTQAYLLFYPYTNSSYSPPQPVQAKFAQAVSAAVSSGFLFVGGFVTTDYIGEGTRPIFSGLLLGINRMDGEALFGFRIQSEQGPTQNVIVYGVDAYRECAYIAGRSENYRLEYVFLNNFNFTFPSVFVDATAQALGGKHERRDDRPDVNGWTPTFDKNTTAASYAFYGVFCAGSLIASTTSTTTVTSTSTITSTTTETSTTYITSTSTTTQTTVTTSTIRQTTTSTETSYVTNQVYETFVVYTTSYFTRERTVESTRFTTMYETLRTTLTDSTTVTDVFYTTVPSVVRITTGVGANTTTTVYLRTTDRVVTTTTAVVSDFDWSRLPPVFFTPFFLLPIPLAAVLISRTRTRMVINKSQQPPHWSGGSRIIDDVYFTPSVLNIRKNTTVTFVNEDEIPHVIVAYEGPAEHLFSSEEIKPGKKWKHKFVEPGVYHIASLNKPYAGGIIRVGR